MTRGGYENQLDILEQYITRDAFLKVRRALLLGTVEQIFQCQQAVRNHLRLLPKITFAKRTLSPWRLLFKKHDKDIPNLSEVNARTLKIGSNFVINYLGLR